MPKPAPDFQKSALADFFVYFAFIAAEVVVLNHVFEDDKHITLASSLYWIAILIAFQIGIVIIFLRVNRLFEIEPRFDKALAMGQDLYEEVERLRNCYEPTQPRRFLENPSPEWTAHLRDSHRQSGQ